MVAITHKIWRLALAFVGAVGLASAAIGFALIVPPAPETYADLSLGLSEEEVIYRIGPASAVLGKPEVWEGIKVRRVYYFSGADPKNKLPPGTTPSQYEAWLFGGSAAGVAVKWSAKRTVAEVACTDEGEDHSCPDLLGIGVGTPEQVVVARLGIPTSVDVERGVKGMRYEDLGVTFRLAHRRVYAVELEPRRGGLRAWVHRRWSALTS